MSNLGTRIKSWMSSRTELDPRLAHLATLDSHDDLVAGCIEYFAAAHGLDASEIDPFEPIASLGLDSVKLVEAAGQLEKAFAIRLPTTFFWDYPTIDAMSARLLELRAERSTR